MGVSTETDIGWLVSVGTSGKVSDKATYAGFRAQCLTKCYFEASVRNASEDLVDIVKGENRRGRRAFKENVTDTLAPSDVCEYGNAKFAHA